jgi:hypothetical protein
MRWKRHLSCVVRLAIRHCWKNCSRHSLSQRHPLETSGDYQWLPISGTSPALSEMQHRHGLKTSTKTSYINLNLKKHPKIIWTTHGFMFWIDLDMRYWEFARPSIIRFKKQEIIAVRMWEKNVKNIQAQTLRTVRLCSDRMSWRSSFARACQAQYLWIWL